MGRMTGHHARIDLPDVEEAVEYLDALEWILRQNMLDEATLELWRENHPVMEPLRYGREIGGPDFVANNVAELRGRLDRATAIAHLDFDQDTP
jgi:hypothetical protein